MIAAPWIRRAGRSLNVRVRLVSTNAVRVPRVIEPGAVGDKVRATVRVAIVLRAAIARVVIVPRVQIKPGALFRPVVPRGSKGQRGRVAIVVRRAPVIGVPPGQGRRADVVAGTSP